MAEEEDSPPSTPVGQHGGRRPNAGRRTKAEEAERGAYGTLAKAKAKNELFKANLAELEFKQRTGQLLPVEEVIRVWTEQIHIAKERLLSIPARVAPTILRMTELRDVEHCLRDALHVVLEELSRGDLRQP
jgi:hypothetical protein